MNSKATKIKFVPSPTESANMEYEAGPSAKRRALNSCSNYLSSTINMEEIVLYSADQDNHNHDDAHTTCVCKGNESSMDTDSYGDCESKCICWVVIDSIKRFRLELIALRKELAKVYAENNRLKAQLQKMSA